MPTVHDYQPCRVPLRRIPWCGATIVVHEGLVPSLNRIWHAWERAGGPHRYPIRADVTGAYNCRKTTSGSSWSKHAYGCAIDVNWDKNPFGRRLVTDMPDWVVALFTDEDYGWGGHWSSVKDAMHYSRFPNEGGSGVLYDGHDPGPVFVPLPPPPATAPRPKPWAVRVRSKPALEPGAVSYDVAILQSLLVAHGNRPGSWYGRRPYGHKPDGIFGEGLRGVLGDWQGRTGVLAPDGVCGPETWSWLLPEPPQLEEGNVSYAAAIAQALLVGHGNKPGPWFGGKPYGHQPDGNYGGGTAAVVRSWQRRTGVLSSDGIVGPATWQWLAGVR